MSRSIFHTHTQRITWFNKTFCTFPWHFCTQNPAYQEVKSRMLAGGLYWHCLPGNTILYSPESYSGHTHTITHVQAHTLLKRPLKLTRILQTILRNNWMKDRVFNISLSLHSPPPPSLFFFLLFYFICPFLPSFFLFYFLFTFPLERFLEFNSDFFN